MILLKWLTFIPGSLTVTLTVVPLSYNGFPFIGKFTKVVPKTVYPHPSSIVIEISSTLFHFLSVKNN